MQDNSFLKSLRNDPWFAAFICGEAIVVGLGLILPLVFPFSHQGPLSLLIAITLFRLFVLWGLAARRAGFHRPYIFGTLVFFLCTSSNLHELVRYLSGYYGATVHWGTWLTIFAWVIRIIGVTWCLKRGRHSESGSEFPAAFALATQIVLTLAMFTVFGLFLPAFSRLFYGIFIESM